MRYYNGRMVIEFYDKLDKEKYINNIRQLLEKCDKEFVPPLSVRQSTTQTSLKDLNTNSNSIEDYLKNIKDQDIIVALDNDIVVGFMTYKKNYTCEHISTNYSINIYITTILVDPEFRKRGITKEFYRLLLDRYGDRYIFTRTWSTNIPHINLLTSLNFYEHCVLENDRGHNIDTIYFCR